MSCYLFEQQLYVQCIGKDVYKVFCVLEIAYTINYKCSNKAEVHFILFLVVLNTFFNAEMPRYTVQS